MKSRKVVLIGGVAGGASAAARLRRLDESAQIVVFERSGYISYANCGLPYYVGGVITDPDELTLQTPESFWKRFRVAVKVRHEVTAIDPARKCVMVHDLQSNAVFEESYDKLILATGARPVQPALPGMDNERVFTLRTVEDAFRIREWITRRRPRTAVVIGGGFIGLEMAENLMKQNLSVTIVEKSQQLLPPFDADMASLIHAQFRDRGASLVLGVGIAGFRREGDGIAAMLESGESLSCDLAVLAIGVVPDTALARDAGLELGVKGSIAVNARMETSVPDIYAIGDAAQVRHSVTGENAVIPLAGPANRQGRIAADNICAGNQTYHGAQGSSILQIFDMTAACTGISERGAKAAGISYEKVVLSPASHAGYYPGAQVMTMKVLFEKETGKLLGAQIVGYAGVDKRIDVLATAIYAGLTAVALKELDLAYAPPYSSAKDPVNLAGLLAENLLTGKVAQYHVEQLDTLPRDGSATLLDVRTPAEYAQGHVDGFDNIPLDDLRERLDEIDPDKPVYVMCQSALRSYLACRILSQHRFECSHLSGGYRFYSAIRRDQLANRTAYPCGMETPP